MFGWSKFGIDFEMIWRFLGFRTWPKQTTNKPQAIVEASSGSAQTWRVVGGRTQGGIIAGALRHQKHQLFGIMSTKLSCFHPWKWQFFLKKNILEIAGKTWRRSKLGKAESEVRHVPDGVDKAGYAGRLKHGGGAHRSSRWKHRFSHGKAF